MRNEVQFGYTNAMAPSAWCERLMMAIGAGAHPALLYQCGVTAPLLAYCGIKLNVLLEQHNVKNNGVITSEATACVRYPLEHVIEAFELKMEDLILLGFRLSMLRQPKIYPLIVLYDMCGFRADTLFGFDISYSDLERNLLRVDERYATLLNLNLHWLARVIGNTT